MVVLATLVSLDVGVQSGWKIPGIGSVGFGTGSNSTGSGTVTTTGTSGSNYVTCTQTSCPPNSILPSGQVEFNMKLLAVYTDGTNSSIANQQGIPNLAQISFNGKPLDHIDTQALVGYVSSLPLPPGSTATYVVNETALNSKTNYMTWHSFNYETGFVDNNTVSLFLLPDFKMPAVQVYSDVCNTNSTGGVTCNLPEHTSDPAGDLECDRKRNRRGTRPIRSSPLHRQQHRRLSWELWRRQHSRLHKLRIKPTLANRGNSHRIYSHRNY